MRDRPALRALAKRMGILPEFTDVDGRVRRTSDATRVRLLHAMGIDAESEPSAAQAIERVERISAARVIDPVRVVNGRSTSQVAIRVPVSLWRRRITWRMTVTAEDGTAVRTLDGVEGTARSRIVLASSIRLPEHGYYGIHIELGAAGRVAEGEQFLIVAPAQCAGVRDRSGSGRRFGLLANLYSVRGPKSWGVGDLGDLRSIVDWCADAGGAFVGINPLHAIRNAGGGVSPYFPVSRLFDNPLYLVIDRVPEVRTDPTVRRLVSSPEVRNRIAECRSRPDVPYEPAWQLKRRVLEAAFAAFRREERGTVKRGRAYLAFIREQGERLERFATHQALAGEYGPDWRRWPAPLRSVRGPAVEAFRASHPTAIDFERWLQFEIDRQLAAVGRRAHTRLPIGMLTDLAIGCAPSGADPWTDPDLFVHGATIGAPPDDYAADGQDWVLPPLDPTRLVDSGFAYWIAIVRHVLRHAGAVRLDHAMGLLRQYWIPAGARAADGAYVRYPSDALFAILAVESRRRDAIIVGEDLGTVPRGFSALLARWGVLSTRVLYFERDGRRFHPSQRYSRRALVTAGTHDHPPLAGFWEGRDLEMRRETGSLASERALAAARRVRSEERQALVRRLVREGTLPTSGALTAEQVIPAVHRFLGRTPAPLVGVMLDDLAAEREPVNLPGVPQDRHASWTRRMGRSIAEVRRGRLARSILADLRRQRG